ncbi:MAG: site-specific DNA-methyltransferase [Proteobacteria bacterium]|nr:site-specific DNA-methyltransferase [Pseudomonadota bacterium]
MHEKLNDNFILKNGGYSNYEDTTNLPRHRWYYYKEGFSPTLVEKAIEQTGVARDDLIIDPFNGSGTTTLTASLLGHKSVGIEVNPFTSFLSDAKIKNAEISQLNRLENKLLKSVETGKPSPLLGFSTFSETEKLDKWLFNNDVLNSFEGGWKHTYSITGSNVRKLIRLALISAAMQNCNAKRDGKCLRYRDTWKKNRFDKESFLRALIQNLSNIKSDIQENPIHIKSKILKGDCRNILKTSNELKNFKLCITSPPYLNTFDYTDIYRPELFLGKFIKSRQKLYDLRLETVRSHVQAKWQEPMIDDFGILYEKTMIHINKNKENLMSKYIPLMIQAYFEDMLNVLNLLKAKATKDSQIWFVVSNSAYAGLELPVDLIIGDIATKAGWYLKEIGVLRYVKKRKTKYSPDIKELRESVIILSSSKF